MRQFLELNKLYRTCSCTQIALSCAAQQCLQNSQKNTVANPRLAGERCRLPTKKQVELVHKHSGVPIADGNSLTSEKQIDTPTIRAYST